MCPLESTVYLIGLCLAIVPAAFGEFYSAIHGYLCINSNYVESHPECFGNLNCASLCSSSARCQAFTTADGPCQLFVFDACSKSVRDCTCSRRGQVFVKQRAGLEPGQLCPSGYGDDLCGVKYKLTTSQDYWWPSRQKCESEIGLVIMADVIDATEMSHVDSLYTKYSTGSSFWLGGYQPAGSVEPRGGWYWVGCNITLDGNLWGTGEPNNGGVTGENVVGIWTAHARLADFWESVTTFKALCECASPLD